MLSRFTDRAVPEVLDCDVCIIGAGAAGITLAHMLSGSGLRIILLESGSVDMTEEAASLSAGTSEGLRFVGLQEGRTRAFGGATRLWYGQCIRLDPIDFAARSWVPNSGWPIGRKALDPYYDRAEAFLGLHPPVYYDARNWSRFGVADPGFDPYDVVPAFTIYCREPDFRRAFLGTLQRAPGVDILIGATALDIILGHSACLTTAWDT